MSGTAPTLRVVIDDYLKRSEVELVPAHEVDNISMAISLVASTRGRWRLVPLYVRNFFTLGRGARPLAGRWSHDRPRSGGITVRMRPPILELFLSENGGPGVQSVKTRGVYQIDVEAATEKCTRGLLGVGYGVRLRAVTWISICMRGSDRPAEIMVAAGARFPGICAGWASQSGKRAASGRMYMTRTISAKSAPCLDEGGSNIF